MSYKLPAALGRPREMSVLCASWLLISNSSETAEAQPINQASQNSSSLFQESNHADRFFSNCVLSLVKNH